MSPKSGFFAFDWRKNLLFVLAWVLIKGKYLLAL